MATVSPDLPQASVSLSETVEEQNEAHGTTLNKEQEIINMEEETLEELKKKGNDAVNSGKLDEAVLLYTVAIQKCSTTDATNTHLLGILYSNRSIANYHIGNYKLAADDASASLEQRPTWVKAFHRKATSVSAIGDFAQAAELYKQALELEPNNKWIKEHYRSMLKQLSKAPLKTEGEWQHLYENLSPQPMRMSTLVHFWNICTKPERYAALQRLSELANYRFSMQEEQMAELPLERYRDIVVPEKFLNFFIELASSKKINILEMMWNKSTDTEKELIMHDLTFYFRENAKEDPGNDSDDEEGGASTSETSSKNAQIH